MPSFADQGLIYQSCMVCKLGQATTRLKFLSAGLLGYLCPRFALAITFPPAPSTGKIGGKLVLAMHQLGWTRVNSLVQIRDDSSVTDAELENKIRVNWSEPKSGLCALAFNGNP